MRTRYALFSSLCAPLDFVPSGSQSAGGARGAASDATAAFREEGGRKRSLLRQIAKSFYLVDCSSDMSVQAYESISDSSEVIAQNEILHTTFVLDLYRTP